jgi:hypothetical protein
MGLMRMLLMKNFTIGLFDSYDINLAIDCVYINFPNRKYILSRELLCWQDNVITI